MATLKQLLFEVERRLIILHRDTTLENDTTLGYVGNPNNVIENNTPGETLLYYAPEGVVYLDKGQTPSVPWLKLTNQPGGSWFEIIQTATGGDDVIIDRFTLDVTDISNGFVILSQLPNANETKMSVKSAPYQFYGVDFTVNGNKIEWQGLGLDGLLQVGDNVTVTYTKA